MGFQPKETKIVEVASLETKTDVSAVEKKPVEEKPRAVYLPRSSVRPYVPNKITTEYLDQVARNFIVGNETVARSRDVRRDLEDKVVKRIGRKGKYLVDKIFELIEGVYVVDNVSGKTLRYYKKEPNLTAIIYALDRVLGKPRQTVDKSEEKRGIFVVEHIIRQLATPGKVEEGNLNNQNGNGESSGKAVDLRGGIGVGLGGEVADGGILVEGRRVVGAGA